MKFTIMTLFPDMVRTVLNESIIGRAQKEGLLQIEAVNIRDFTEDKHKRVDDYPYGGGSGMVMRCQPIYDCFRSIAEKEAEKPYTVYMSPQGKVLTQQKAVSLSKKDHIVILCGHYEGVDERVLEEIVDEEISIGDYVLTGGEMPACILVDCISRMIDGVLSDSAAYQNESHFNGLLEYPQYTRPEVWHGKKVPDVLLSGHHKNILQWQAEMSLARTLQKRPDLLEKSEDK